MEVAPLTINTPQEPESMIIEKDEKKYILNIIKEEDYIILNILEKDIFPNTKYIKKLSFKEIKELHKIFSILNSCNEFLDYFKSALENKKINIKKDIEKLVINISVEYLFKNSIIEIPLLEQKINLQDFSKEICKEISIIKETIKELKKNMVDKNEYNILLDKVNQQKTEISDLKEENKKLKNDIGEILRFKEEIKSIIEKQNNENKNLKEEIQNMRNSYQELKKNIIIKQNEIKELNDNKKQEEKKEINGKININSVIMKNEEFDMIKNAIESRMNKKVKEVKKLYQATVDGGDVSIFHAKCDNIPNTLIIYKSEGNRRFGGFTSNIWDTKLSFKYDKNSFLFSLDKNKIYSYIKNSHAILCGMSSGPSFGYKDTTNCCTIKVIGNPIKYKKLYTYESDSGSYDFNGDNNALSEDGKGNKIYAKEYEVFQIIFS